MRGRRDEEEDKSNGYIIRKEMLPVKAGQNGSSPFTSLKPKTTKGSY